jgi:transcriptional regulator with XRE-family HTH domain
MVKNEKVLPFGAWDLPKYMKKDKSSCPVNISERGLMGTSINERLKTIRTLLKLSQRDFSKGIFLVQSAYARMEQGKTRINDRIIELVCSKYHVGKTYLKDGKGEMFTDKGPPDVKLEQLIRIFNELNPLFQDYLIIQAKELFNVQLKEARGEHSLHKKPGKPKDDP